MNKKIIFSSVLLLSLLAIIFIPAFVFAGVCPEQCTCTYGSDGGITGLSCKGSGGGDDGGGGGGGGGGGAIDSIMGGVMTAAYGVGIPLIIVGWVIAGILYLTSAGNPQRMGVAKQALIAAVIGTLLVMLAGAATSLVSSTFGI